MTPSHSLQTEATGADIASPSVPTGATKTADEENFPVGSWLLPKHLRSHIATYYAFARAIDDIADDPGRTAQQKVDELDAMEAVLKGAPAKNLEQNVAAKLRVSLLDTGVPIEHGTDLCIAFRLDAVKPRTNSWEELLTYCRYSAAPVGRYLLDLHGESQSCWPASDALCASLQIINHLQDCQDDFLTMDRVYIPEDQLAAAQLSAEILRQDAMVPALRTIFDLLLDEVDELNQLATTLPPLIKDRRMRLEASVIVEIALRLSALLRTNDPIATRVELSRLGKVGCLLRGLRRGLA